jgi:hypothetical protein
MWDCTTINDNVAKDPSIVVIVKCFYPNAYNYFTEAIAAKRYTAKSQL